MKDKTRELMNEVREAHDWDKGQAWGGGGTKLSRTDTCRVCGLRMHWMSDTQNGIEDRIRWSDGETDEDLSLRQAAARGCA